MKKRVLQCTHSTGRKTIKGFYNAHIQQEERQVEFNNVHIQWEEKQVKGSTMYTFNRKKNR